MMAKEGEMSKFEIVWRFYLFGEQNGLLDLCVSDAPVQQEAFEQLCIGTDNIVFSFQLHSFHRVPLYFHVEVVFDIRVKSW
jgi:hypothetical protein